MANEGENGAGPPRRPPIRLVGFVLLVGTFLSWWGTRDQLHYFGELPRTPVAAGVLSVAPTIPLDDALVARGSQVEQHQCAGCHELFKRSVGPSYQEVVSFYSRDSQDTGGRADLLSHLSSATAHPQPGWGNFAPGPAQSGLSSDDRVAVASWIVRRVSEEKTSTEGAER